MSLLEALEREWQMVFNADDLPADQKRAYLLGIERAMQLASEQAERPPTLAPALDATEAPAHIRLPAGGPAEPHSEDRPTHPLAREDDEPDPCGECGGQVVRSLGGAACMECGEEQDV